MKRPNLLFIMTDQQRFDAMGWVNPAVKTPNLDALAEEGIAFTRAYTSNPSCIPARAALLTGRYPSQCQVPTYLGKLPETETTFMSLLQRQGYYTAVIGKQHFAGSAIERGYDDEEINDMHAPAGLKRAGEQPPSYLQYLLSEGFEEPGQLFEKENRFSARWTADVRYHLDDFIGERGIAWLKEKRPEKPWFLCLSFPGPHSPYDGSGTPYADLYKLENIDLPKTTEADLARKPPHFKAQLETGHGNPGGAGAGGMTELELRQTRRSYYANMSLIDDKIGQVLDELKATGQYDDTLIIFTSDHGDFMGDFGMMGKGQYLSEVLMRVPLLVKPPKPYCGSGGRREDGLVSNVDLAATFLAAAGADIPANMASRDLSPCWMADNRIRDRAAVYMEAAGMRGIRTDRWKYVHYLDRTYGELYDLEADPWELRNLWEDPSLLSLRSELQGQLLHEVIRTGTRSEMLWNKTAPQI